jgi:hypothetical protein
MQSDVGKDGAGEGLSMGRGYLGGGDVRPSR